MKLVATSATALTLVLALAACGSGEKTADTTTTTADTTTTAATPAPVDTASAAPVVDSATPAPAPSPTPTPSSSMKPSPTPSPSATTAAATKPAEFAQCSACHSTDPGKNGIGPSLAHVYGRKAGSVAGFDYSDAMKNSGLTWNKANLDRFLTDPKGVVPGTKMTFPGLKDAAKRQAMIDYLKSL